MSSSFFSQSTCGSIRNQSIQFEEEWCASGPKLYLKPFKQKIKKHQACSEYKKRCNWMKMNSVKYPVWLKVLSKPAILKYHRSQASLKPQGIKDSLFVIMHETNWEKTQLEVETITERIGRRYGTSAGGMPSGGRHCNKTSCSRRTSLPSGSCSKFFLRSDKHRNIFLKPKQPKNIEVFPFF